ncbi:uncharacterized protein LOC111258281 [Setaria italica]|uniref:uncharacterized protein LOC111258281 n=1 Tax=Setaria italica TaxID=4555 RepID=UPI000BE51B88|nr:uncharacterized protein LOC111258281 [Setaria italica]
MARQGPSEPAAVGALPAARQRRRHHQPCRTRHAAAAPRLCCTACRRLHRRLRRAAVRRPPAEPGVAAGSPDSLAPSPAGGSRHHEEPHDVEAKPKRRFSSPMGHRSAATAWRPSRCRPPCAITGRPPFPRVRCPPEQIKFTSSFTSPSRISAAARLCLSVAGASPARDSPGRPPSTAAGQIFSRCTTSPPLKDRCSKDLKIKSFKRARAEEQ